MKSAWISTSILLVLSNVLLSDQAYRDVSSSVVFKWRAAEFDYSSGHARSEAVKRGQYIPNNVAIIDADYHAPTKRYFVTSPQFANGIPATLSEVTKGQGELKPFPNWPQNNANKCQGPFSVYRINIDKCGLMWVLDSGRGDIFNTSTLTCQPKLLVYDLNSKDREVLRYEFPKGVFSDRSILINIITESHRSDCFDTFAYIADVNDHGLIVFDYARRASWRIENKWFYPSPADSTVNTNGVTFDLMDGLFGLALGPSTDSQRKLYFHCFASLRESSVPISVLKNPTMAQDPSVARTAFVSSSGQRAGQSTVEVMTDDGVLIYALIPMNAIVCWNTKKPFTLENQHILERDNENFQFISGMKLKDNKLVMLSSRLQNYIVGNVNGTDSKYRVIVIEDVKRLLQNTPCSSGFGGSSHSSTHVPSGYHHGRHSSPTPDDCVSSFCEGNAGPTQSSEVHFRPKQKLPVHSKVPDNNGPTYSYAHTRFGETDGTQSPPEEAIQNGLLEANDTTNPQRTSPHSNNEQVNVDSGF